MKSYRLGFDIDEVVNNLNEVLIKYAKKTCGVEFKYNDIYRKYTEDLHISNRIIGDVLSSAANSPEIQSTTIPMKNSPISILKLKQMETAGGALIDNRVDDSPQKITNRHSLLRSGVSRRYK